MISGHLCVADTFVQESWFSINLLKHLPLRNGQSQQRTRTLFYDHKTPKNPLYNGHFKDAIYFLHITIARCFKYLRTILENLNLPYRNFLLVQDSAVTALTHLLFAP